MNYRHTERSAGPEAAQVVIIGGGISGLSAAFYLERAAAPPLSCVVVERAARLGGKIQTETVAGEGGAFVIEGGPDSFVAQKPWAIELARELGLGEQLRGTLPSRHSASVLVGGKPRPLPEGMSLAVPTKLWPFVRSPLLSPLGKLRMALDLVIPARRGDADETLADFIRRRLGREALDRLAEPIMAGVHSAECERQSLLATFPRFRAIEREHGSLIRGMRAAKRAAGQAGQGAPASAFLTLEGGMGTLIDALAAQIRAPLLTGRGVAAIERGPAGEAGRRYRVRLDDGSALEADAVIVATPAFAAADLLAPLDGLLAQALRGIRYVSTATVSLAYRQADVGAPLGGYGLVIPRSERRRINAVTLTTAKFAGRAPQGHALVRVFAGGSRTPESLALDDAGLVELARAELRATLGISAAPLLARVSRWESGNPQYDIGHIERVAAIERRLPAGLALASAAYHGVGIPDCVRQGREAAERTLDQLRVASEQLQALSAVR